MATLEGERSQLSVTVAPSDVRFWSGAQNDRAAIFGRLQNGAPTCSGHPYHGYIDLLRLSQPSALHLASVIRSVARLQTAYGVNIPGEAMTQMCALSKSDAHRRPNVVLANRSPLHAKPLLE